MTYKNHEGYPDPVQGEAIRNADKPPERVCWFIKTIKSLADILELEIVGRIVIRDKDTGRQYR